MEPSWYVENGCLDVDSLQPIWFIVAASFMQIIITAILLVGEKPWKYDDKIHHNNTVQHPTE